MNQLREMKDSLRYRWLRKQFSEGKETYIGESISSESESDEYIDKAMLQGERE